MEYLAKRPRQRQALANFVLDIEVKPYLDLPEPESGAARQ